MKNQMTVLICLLLSAGLLGACAGNSAGPPPPSPTPTLEATARSTRTPTTAPAATETIQPTPLPVGFVWKITGNPNRFDAPVGIAIDAQGSLYVMDTKNARVKKFDRSGKFSLMWGGPGESEGQFKVIVPDEGRLAVDSQGDVYVIDVSNFRIQKFDSNGTFLTQWGSKGIGEGQFMEPADIAIDKQDNIFVGDYQNPVVQKFDKDGKFLLRWGSAGGKDGEFAGIYSLATTQEETVLVSDESGRIQEFLSDGKFLTKITPASIENISITLWNIAVDVQGNIYIADNPGVRIVKLNRQGEVINTWRGGNIPGAAKFDYLQDIAVDEQGNIFISDSASNLVQKFRQ